jgi:hypothetical protein
MQCLKRPIPKKLARQSFLLGISEHQRRRGTSTKISSRSNVTAKPMLSAGELETEGGMECDPPAQNIDRKPKIFF